MSWTIISHFPSICHSLTAHLHFYCNLQILRYLFLGTLWMYVPVCSCAWFCGSGELLSQGDGTSRELPGAASTSSKAVSPVCVPTNQNHKRSPAQTFGVCPKSLPILSEWHCYFNFQLLVHSDD